MIADPTIPLKGVLIPETCFQQTTAEATALLCQICKHEKRKGACQSAGKAGGGGIRPLRALQGPGLLGFPIGNPGILASFGTQLGTQGAILGLFSGLIRP